MKHLNIQPKTIKHRGVIHEGKNYEGSVYNADTFGKHHTTIRIYGTEAFFGEIPENILGLIHRVYEE